MKPEHFQGKIIPKARKNTFPSRSPKSAMMGKKEAPLETNHSI